MHPFVEKFIDSNFENELNSKKLSFESDTYHNWLSPAVEIPNFDLNIIQNIKKLCEKSESQFVPVSGSYINNNWYSISGTDSWQELPLLLALQNEKIMMKKKRLYFQPVQNGRINMTDMSVETTAPSSSVHKSKK
jgi:hypothetical protein